MSVNVGSAYATFELNIKSFLDAIKTANAHLDRAMQTMAHAERTAAQTGPGIGKAFEIVATALRRTSDEAQQAGRSVRGGAQSFGELAQQAGQSGKSINILERSLGGLQEAFGALGVSFGVAAITQFAVQSMQAAQALEDVQATVKAVVGDVATYNEIVAAAREQQRRFGTSLADSIAQLGGLAQAARSSGVSVQALADVAQRLLLIDPSAQFEDAAIALREALSGDMTSLAERFELPRSALRSLADEGMSGAEKLALLDQLLTEMGATTEALDARTQIAAQSYREFGAALEGFQLAAGSALSRGFAPLIDGLTWVTEQATVGLRAITDRSAMVDELLAQSEAVQALALAQKEYARASSDVQAVYQRELAALTALQDQQKKLTERVIEYTLVYGKNSPAVIAAMQELQAIQEEFGTRSLALRDQLINANKEAAEAAIAAERARVQQAVAEALAYGQVNEALEILRQQTQLAEEEVKQLEKALDKALAGGATAIQELAANDAAFAQDRLASAAAYREQLRELEQRFQEEQTRLQQAMAEADTERERERMQERLALLAERYEKEREATEAAYQERERRAAEQYAREQAAQLAHLGQMLIDYVRAQAALAGISDDQVAAMTKRIAEEFGIQQTVVGRSYDAMIATLDKWVAYGGEDIDTYVGHLRTLTAEASQAQTQVSQTIAAMTEAARQDFERGAISIDEYIARLTSIPAEAERVVAQTRTALASLAQTVETARQVQDQRAGERTLTVPTRREVTPVAGPRARGGYVAPRGLYTVGEYGRPELLTVGNQAYLVMGDQAGMVTPLTIPAISAMATPPPRIDDVSGNRSPVTVTINVAVDTPHVDSVMRLNELTTKITQSIKREMSMTIERLLVGGV
jgi:hypothetical protein